MLENSRFLKVDKGEVLSDENFRAEERCLGMIKVRWIWILIISNTLTNLVI